MVRGVGHPGVALRGRPEQPGGLIGVPVGQRQGGVGDLPGGLSPGGHPGGPVEHVVDQPGGVRAEHRGDVAHRRHPLGERDHPGPSPVLVQLHQQPHRLVPATPDRPAERGVRQRRVQHPVETTAPGGDQRLLDHVLRPGVDCAAAPADARSSAVRRRLRRSASAFRPGAARTLVGRAGLGRHRRSGRRVVRRRSARGAHPPRDRDDVQVPLGGRPTGRLRTHSSATLQSPRVVRPGPLVGEAGRQAVPAAQVEGALLVDQLGRPARSPSSCTAQARFCTARRRLVNRSTRQCSATSASSAYASARRPCTAPPPG